MNTDITQYLKETAYGHNAGQVATALRKYFKEVLQMKGVKVRKETEGDVHYGGRVTGEHRKTINVFIETKKAFNLIDFIDAFRECEFIYDSPERVFPVPYVVNIQVNGVQLIGSYVPEGGYKETVIDTKFRDTKVTEKMFWLNALEQKGYDTTFKEFGKKL